MQSNKLRNLAIQIASKSKVTELLCINTGSPLKTNTLMPSTASLVMKFSDHLVKNAIKKAKMNLKREEPMKHQCCVIFEFDQDGNILQSVELLENGAFTLIQINWLSLEKRFGFETVKAKLEKIKKIHQKRRLESKPNNILA